MNEGRDAGSDGVDELESDKRRARYWIQHRGRRGGLYQLLTFATAGGGGALLYSGIPDVSVPLPEDHPSSQHPCINVPVLLNLRHRYQEFLQNPTIGFKTYRFISLRPGNPRLPYNQPPQSTLYTPRVLVSANPRIDSGLATAPIRPTGLDFPRGTCRRPGDGELDSGCIVRASWLIETMGV